MDVHIVYHQGQGPDEYFGFADRFMVFLNLIVNVILINKDIHVILMQYS